MSHDNPPHSGSVFSNRYQIIELIQGGGYAFVMRARDLTTGLEVALKCFEAVEPEDLPRFHREIGIMMRTQHPNVATILDTDMNHEPPYCVMPLAEGTLDVWADGIRHKERNLDAILAIVRRIVDVCNGVIFLHDSGVLHRDLKPTNMLYYGSGTVVSDLGLARGRDSDASKLTRTTSVIGTEAYLAPELRNRGGSSKADSRSEVYALGRSIYELVTGQDPTPVDESLLPPVLAGVVTKAV